MQVLGLPKRVAAVSMGYAHGAAVIDEGSVYTWGSGEFGQLGHGSCEESLVPKKVRACASIVLCAGG